jgi:hypothetical protein
MWARRRGRSIPAAGYDNRPNAAHGQKDRFHRLPCRVAIIFEKTLQKRDGTIFFPPYPANIPSQNINFPQPKPSITNLQMNLAHGHVIPTTNVDCGGKRSATPLFRMRVYHRQSPVIQERRRRPMIGTSGALPVQSKKVLSTSGYFKTSCVCRPLLVTPEHSEGGWPRTPRFSSEQTQFMTAFKP